MKRTRIITVVKGRCELGAQVVVCGWVRTRRDSRGGFSFIHINDGSCFDTLQVIADTSLSNYEQVVLHLTVGCSIRVRGVLIKSKGQEQALELQAESITLLGACDPETYPLQKKRMSLELLRDQAHLRPRTNTFGAMARVRNLLAAEVHCFFQARGFLYVHTPIITANDCEGAGEMFRVTTLPADNRGAVPNFEQDFFGRETHLTVSGQLQGECYACALGDVYTFGPTFRAEDSNTRRHLAEFWMIEPEMAFADLEDDATTAEAFVEYLAQTVLDKAGADLDFFNQRIDTGLISRLEALAKGAFERLSYTEAMARLQKGGPFDFQPQWGQDLQSEHEKFLTEQLDGRGVIVTDYPKDIKPFYMRLNDDGKTVAAMDVLVPGVGELIGGSQREERTELMVQRMEASGILPDNYDWYLDLRRFGSVPHAGFGPGFERLVQLMTGLNNIRDAIPFPRTPGRARF